MPSPAFYTPAAAILLIQGVVVLFLAWRSESRRQPVSEKVRRDSMRSLAIIGAANAVFFTIVLVNNLMRV